MSNQELVSPVTMDGFALQQTQQVMPTLTYIRIPPVAQLPGSVTLPTGDIGPAASVVISRAAQFYSELQLLQSRNPDQYKQVLTGIGDSLIAATPNATGAEQQLLSQLADRFQQAANGDLSALQPPPPPVSADFLPHPLSPTSTLSNLVIPQEHNAVNIDLMALQEHGTLVSTLTSPPARHALTNSSLLATQATLPDTIGDLFLHSAVNLHGVVAVYGPHGQLLTEAFQSQDTTTYQPQFSANTQQALDSIFNDLHNALFGVSAAAGAP